MSSGIEPGVAVSIKSSNDCVYTTLAFSALQSLLTAHSGGWAGMGVGAGMGTGGSGLPRWERRLLKPPAGQSAPPPAAPPPRRPTDWQQLHGGGAGARALLPAGGASSMHVLVENRLGVGAALELDYGDHLWAPFFSSFFP